MKLLDRLINSVMPKAKTDTAISAAVDPATVPLPKAKGKQATLPSYLTTAKPSTTSQLQLEDRRTANKDITTYRTSASTRDTIRQFVKSSPDLSAAVTSYVRVGITSGYVAVAKNTDGTFNPEATKLLHQLLTRMNVLGDPTVGFDDGMSIRSACESWARELMTYGAMSGELVLNKARLPDKIQPISTSQILYYPSSDGRRSIPHQKVAGEDIPLDVPTFFVVTLDQDLLSAYADSPIEPALQAVIFSADFMNDVRRIVKRAIHPRMTVTLDAEKFMKEIPQDIRQDSDKLIAYRNAVLADITNRINGLAPEEAIVVFDTIGIEVVDHGNTNLSNEYQVIEGLANSKMATGAKVLPTVLGHSDGTSNVASAEVLLFMKYVEGSVWAKLNEMLSKVLTLAVRLLGLDVIVEFCFNAIDLRPESELESFKALKQSRVLDLLSLGMMSDEEACLQLTGHLPPDGYKPLTGTMFRQPAKADPTGNNYNGASNDGSTMNQNLKSDAPKGGARGQNNKQAETVVPFSTAR